MATTSTKMLQMTEKLKINIQNDFHDIWNVFYRVGVTQIIHTCSEVGAVFCVALFFNERFRLFGELFWYLDINKLAMISDNFSS